MNQANTGALVISLDFELFWGMFDHETRENYRGQIMGAREAVPKMLELFDRYQIHATWGVVGMLMAENKDELTQYIPSVIPRYCNSLLSSHDLIREIGDNEQEDCFHYAHSLVSKILTYQNQELGSHTFSHYYCSAEGQTPEAFRADLLAAKSIASNKFGIELSSLIFPRNSFSADHVRIAEECGFTSYRGNPKGFAYNSNGELARAVRLVDTYISICQRKCYRLNSSSGGIANVQASAFFRKYNPRLSALEPLKNQCIKFQMTKAARNGEIFHLWWHPHNIGDHLDQCLAQLEQLFIHYTKLNEKYGFASRNMNEIAEMMRQ